MINTVRPDNYHANDLLMFLVTKHFYYETFIGVWWNIHIDNIMIQYELMKRNKYATRDAENNLYGMCFF